MTTELPSFPYKLTLSFPNSNVKEGNVKVQSTEETNQTRSYRIISRDVDPLSGIATIILPKLSSRENRVEVLLTIFPDKKTDPRFFILNRKTTANQSLTIQVHLKNNVYK